jgi:hypothetical protein
LSIRFPAAACEEAPALPALARRASNFSVIGEGDGASFEATVSDLSEALDQTIRLVAEAQNCPDARVTVDGRTVASLPRFLGALLCYRESLGERNPHDHCLRYSARLNQFSGCPDETCLSPCQFLCTRCLGLAQGKSGAALVAQLKSLARQAEVDWCPNLRFGDPSGPSDPR